MRHNFKVGDKVERIQDEHQGMKTGDQDIITGIDEDGIHLNFQKYTGGHKAEYFELISTSEITEIVIKKLIV